MNTNNEQQHMQQHTVQQSNVFVQQRVFWYSRRVQGACDDQLPLHRSSVYDFNDVYEVLRFHETANKLGVIWCPVCTISELINQIN